MESQVRQFVAKMHNYDVQTMTEIDSSLYMESFTRELTQTSNLVVTHFTYVRELFRPQPNFEGFLNRKLYKLYDLIAAIETRA